MTNLLKRKNLKSIEWTVQSPSSEIFRVTSEAFLFQECECYLSFYSGYNFEAYYAYLSFHSNEKLQFPVTVEILVVFNTEKIHATKTITRANEDIWLYTTNFKFISCRTTFQVIFNGEHWEIDDKSIQTPSYMDNCFLMDGISRDFSKTLSESPCHDVEFICEDQSIKAHKSVLCCRSDVFASMLQSDMVEGKTGRINIKDMDANTLQQFLKCLYTGTLPTLTFDIALQFYEAGDKYNVGSLKRQCAEFLTDNLSPENACDALILADRHNDPDFKKSVIEYMMEEKIPYAGEVWNDFCKTNPVLAVEVLNLYCQHLRPK